MKRAMVIGTLALVLAGCGGTETVYVTATDSPTTTARATTTTTTTTTDAPVGNYLPPVNPTDEFLLQVASSYDGPIYVTDSEMISAGYAVCASLDSGVSAEEVATAVAGASGSDPNTMEFLVAVTASAVLTFCPSHAWKFL